MPNALTPRNLIPLFAGFLLTAASFSAAAVFEAERPGADLSPVGSAAGMIEILQGNRSILWTSLSGPVASIRVEGWPETIENNDLGGALVIERPTDGTTGVVDFGEKPMSIRFDLAG